MSLSDYPGRKPGCVYHIDGYHGRRIDVYPNKCVFTIVPGRQSVGHGEFEAGEKTVWFKDTCSMFYHRSTGNYGWLVLEPYNSSSSYPSSHTFLYSDNEISSRDMDDLVAYINQQMDTIKSCPSQSPAELIAVISRLDQIREELNASTNQKENQGIAQNTDLTNAEKKHDESELKESQKKEEEQKCLEEQRKKEELKRLEEQRRIEEQKRLEEQRKKEELKRLEEQRRIEEQKRLEEQRKKEEQHRKENAFSLELELKSLKVLLDEGVITQEHYDSKLKEYNDSKRSQN